ncbi:hypothetical protein [Ruania halotolerans]|uniref:hypothetical protein n=1 Tax=Ruania halotolerans TaxID=2897773 RepID=UPI001E3DA2FD|nr:hypothetical protein [Ruania halotolerans]UFU05451.1 hypothetical protein LQF10_13480 [Ruania halotolerans]
MRQPRRTATVATMLVALVLTGASLAGCSNDAPDTAEEGSEQSSFATAEEYQLAFAECMRDQGIDMPDPGENGAEIGAGTGDGFMEAAEVCADELGTPPGGDGAAQPGQGQREFDLAMAACLRENGLDVSDPAPEEGLTVPMDAGQELLNECATEAEEAMGEAP